MRVSFDLQYRAMSLRTIPALGRITSIWASMARTTAVGGPLTRMTDTVTSGLGGLLSSRNVSFVGAVPPAEMWRYYADADIYLQTPDIDNMPSSVLEAFASGCAVVSTNAGGVPAILTDDRHGLLVESGDHAAAAERIVRLLEDPALVDRLTISARESCDQYRWETVRSKWVALYNGMVTNRAAISQPTTSAV